MLIRRRIVERSRFGSRVVERFVLSVRLASILVVIIVLFCLQLLVLMRLLALLAFRCGDCGVLLFLLLHLGWAWQYSDTAPPLLFLRCGCRRGQRCGCCACSPKGLRGRIPQ